MTAAQETSAEETYEIRRYEPGDADDVIDLYAEIWGTDTNADWLRHRYIDNPFVDPTTMLVADIGDEVVGARPYVAFPVTANGDQGIGFLLNDLMVHPDHRRRGLFTRMTQRVVADHDGEAAVTLNFANELSAPGYREMGFAPIGHGVYKDVRAQRLEPYMSNRIDGPLGRVVGTVGTIGAATYHGVRGRLQNPPNVDAERIPGIPAERVARLAATPGRDTIETERTGRLYRWLETNTRWQYETYVATSRGRDVAALVTAQRSDDTEGVWIVDAVPTDDTETTHLEGLLGAVTRDHRDAPHIAVTGPVVNEQLLPRTMLLKYGFHSTTNPLFSLLTVDPDTVFVHHLGDGRPRLGGLDLRDPTNWRARIE